MEMKVFQKEIELQSRGWIPTFHDISKEVKEIVAASGIKNGTCADTVRIAKTFHKRIQDVAKQNKRPPVAYERILKEARTRSLAELAVALSTTPEDIKARFEAVE